MFTFIQQCWQRYCQWLDDLGLTEDNRRCCVPLDERAQQAVKHGEEQEPGKRDADR